MLNDCSSCPGGRGAGVGSQERAARRQARTRGRIMQVGTRIRRRRLARGLSQARLADMASVSRGYISRLEAGDFARPSAALLLRIAHALEIDVENLWEDISSA